MKTVNEVSKISGVSVRALHHYDAIGLLKPTKVTEAGYRLYDDTALSRLQSILLFRELQFSLKEIRAILDNPEFDPSEALAKQIELLELQYQHIGEVISFARELQKKGEIRMDFQVFDKSRIEQYTAEAKAKWGATVPYREFRQREKEGQDFEKTAELLMAFFGEIGSLRHLPPDTAAVQEKIRELQNFITGNYYTCTDEILGSLGQMYVEDERMRENIDKAGGEGTAEFVREAIVVYTRTGEKK